MRLGIDFGTTRTVVACADRGNHPVVGFADAAGDAAEWIPSLVAERDGELRFGFDAAAVAGDPSFALVRSFKRLLSRPDAGPSQTVAIGGTVLALGDLMGRFLAYVREALIKVSDVRRSLAHSHELEAAIAVPANAFGAQRFVTLDAFRRAGFHVTAMLNEPSAAGFEYTHRHRDTISSRRDLVVVYDLGGGTFDASVVRMSGRRHDVLATAGVAQLGGDDFDVALASVVLASAGIERSALPARAAEHLLDQCREAKEALRPTSRKITLDLEAALGPDAPQPEVTVPVSDFYDACMPLVQRSIDAMAPMMSRADDDSGGLAEIAGLYVVGGASELPIVARALRQRFGRRVHRSPYPSAAVAIGLSIAADGAAGLVVVDRYARTFGVFREGAAGREITFDPIFAPETELPPAANGPFTSTRLYRAAHNVGHFRFFECSAVDEGGRPKGDMALFGDVYFPFDPTLSRADDLASVPVERRFDEGPRIFEQYSLDENGIVDVLIRNVDCGYERSYRLGRA
ncbi:MAG TPA: Hsp70 family protein [Polyangiaceae bacterium]|nr:Hsp70 family protein [Polyangiaceae bacterium]